MRLPDMQTDETVRDYVVGELMELQRTVDSWADAENIKADKLEESYTKDHFAIARHRERAAAGHALEKIIDDRRRKLERRYDGHELADELKRRADDEDARNPGSDARNI